MEFDFKGTTILGVAKDGKHVIAGDGQATLNNVVFKATAKKVKRIYNDQVIVGFAGGAADGITFCDKFEKMLKKYSGNLLRSAVELAQLWRGDESMRKLDAVMIVADKDMMLVINGVGDVMEPDEGVCAIGSGGNFALAAAKALVQNTKLSAREIAEKSLKVASEMCIYTNDHITVEEI